MATFSQITEKECDKRKFELCKILHGHISSSGALVE